MATLLASAPTNCTQTSASFGQFVAAVREVVPVDDVIVVTTLPRGGLQVCHAMQASQTSVARYGHELNKADSAAWNAITHGYTTAGDSPLAHGLELTIGVAVPDLVLHGFMGAVLLFRRRGSAPVGVDSHVADEIRQHADKYLKSPGRPSEDDRQRQYVFRDDGTLVFPAAGDAFAARLRGLVGSRSADKEGSRRLTVADTNGILTPVTVVRYESYPALASGAVTFVSLYPHAADWERVTPESFTADSEMSRLAGAIEFMTKNYRAGPTLEDIAGSVELSQFHFHRRFTELFGVTPKHLLFDLQLDEAKALLREPTKQLSEVAKHCGFAHQSHFTSRFKQGSGITPTRWRKIVNQAS